MRASLSDRGAALVLEELEQELLALRLSRATRSTARPRPLRASGRWPSSAPARRSRRGRARARPRSCSSRGSRRAWRADAPRRCRAPTRRGPRRAPRSRPSGRGAQARAPPAGQRRSAGSAPRVERARARCGRRSRCSERCASSAPAPGERSGGRATSGRSRSQRPVHARTGGRLRRARAPPRARPRPGPDRACSSASATRPSAPPSSPKIDWTERPTSSTGSCGKASALMARATPPPISASKSRSGGSPLPVGSISTSRIAETAASVTTIGPPSQDHRHAHRQHHEQPELQRAAADHVNEQVGNADAEHHAADQLDGALTALAVGRADADHRGDRGEDRPRLGQQQLRQVPRDATAAMAVCRIGQTRPCRRSCAVLRAKRL